jgi:CheY-like chemotaxis protein
LGQKRDLNGFPKNAFNSQLSMALSPVIGKYCPNISMVPSGAPQSGQSTMMSSHDLAVILCPSDVISTTGIKPMTARILIVENDTDLLGAIEHVLSIAGFNVAVTSHGAEVGELISLFRPDIVITAMIWSDEDSIEWLDEFHRASTKTKVIAISSNGYLLRLAKEHGADFVVQKPFDPHQICGLVRLALDQPLSGAPNAVRQNGECS